MTLQIESPEQNIEMKNEAKNIESQEWSEMSKLWNKKIIYTEGKSKCWFMELCDEMNSSAHDFGTIGFLDYFTIFYDFIWIF